MLKLTYINLSNTSYHRFIYDSDKIKKGGAYNNYIWLLVFNLKGLKGG